jgi:hypothetical protein
MPEKFEVGLFAAYGSALGSTTPALLRLPAARWTRNAQPRVFPRIERRAIGGAGTYLNNRRIHVSSAKRLTDSLSSTGFPSRKRQHNANTYFYYQLAMASHGVRRSVQRRSILPTWPADGWVSSGSSA